MTLHGGRDVESRGVADYLRRRAPAVSAENDTRFYLWLERVLEQWGLNPDRDVDAQLAERNLRISRGGDGRLGLVRVRGLVA